MTRIETGSETIQPALLMVKEVAMQLGVNPPWLYNAIQWKGCPCYRFGTSVRVKLSEVQERLEQRGKENNTSDTTATCED